MKVTSYGLFWSREEIDWEPGQGIRDSFRLLGRIGAQRNTIRVVDFRKQRGIYILYDQYGPAYVGLTKQRGMGQRLKEHTTDHLKSGWDRFSWFGFWPICAEPASNGIYGLFEPDAKLTEDTNTTIGDLEALLIRAIGPKLNRARMNFQDAEEWTQIHWDDTEKYVSRLGPLP